MKNKEVSIIQIILVLVGIYAIFDIFTNWS